MIAPVICMVHMVALLISLQHYVRVVVPVWMLNCASPTDHGVAQYCVPAVLYVAQDEWITHGNLTNQLVFCFVIRDAYNHAK